MKLKLLIIPLFVVLFVQISFAQSNVQRILDSIAQNNKQIAVQKQFAESQKYNYKTGIYLNNPSISYDYLFGNSNEVGNQTELNIVQSFDFPTSYVYKNKIANSKIAQLEFLQKQTKQAVLLQTKLVLNEIVFLNKQKAFFDKRLENAQKLFADYKKKFDNGNASILELNKAKMELINVQNLERQNTNLLNQYRLQLSELNGGKQIVFTDTVYHLHQQLPSFEKLLEAAEANEPDLKLIEQEHDILQNKVSLSKAQSLPKFELGYRADRNSQVNFQGVHFGVTIPLWENKNTVKTAKSEVLYNEIRHDEHHISHESELKQLYENYQNVNQSFTEYKDLISTINTIDLLNKSLSQGQISTIDYFTELNYYYQSIEIYLQLEKELNETLCKLYKYEL